MVGCGAEDRGGRIQVLLAGECEGMLLRDSMTLSRKPEKCRMIAT